MKVGGGGVVTFGPISREQSHEKPDEPTDVFLDTPVTRVRQKEVSGGGDCQAVCSVVDECVVFTVGGGRVPDRVRSVVDDWYLGGSYPGREC